MTWAPLMFLGLLAFAWFGHFQVITWPWLAALALLMMADVLVVTLLPVPQRPSALFILATIAGAALGLIRYGPVGIALGMAGVGVIGRVLHPSFWTGLKHARVVVTMSALLLLTLHLVLIGSMLSVALLILSKGEIS